MALTKFIKLQGCGNNFVVFADFERSPSFWQSRAAALMDRSFGIGGDGLMVLRESPAADFEVCMYNPDGSLMGMCGNGIRCVTRYAVMTGLAGSERAEIRFDVEGRLIVCGYTDEGRSVRVDMGEPSFNPESLPVNAASEMINQQLEAAGEVFNVNCVSMGNPHCVIFRDNINDIPLSSIGPLIENHHLFPKRTNVEFAEVLSPDHIRMRVWERGAGITLACGTGACAVLAVAHRNGLSERKAGIDLPGGTVEIEWREDNNRIFLTGPAHEVFSGEFDPEVFKG